MLLLPDDLVLRWTSLPDLRERSLRWSWFEPALNAAMAAQGDGVAAAGAVNADALAKAFFAWAASVESVWSREPLDPVDFRHFIAGRLLQHLLCSAEPVLDGADAQARGEALTGFVLGLLQAWRLNMGAGAFIVSSAYTGDQWMAGLLENVREDPATAICYLDRMTGLEPVWQSAALIEARPAMRRALGQP